MAYSVSSYMANDPVSGVPAFCTGNAQEEGGQVVTTLTCQEGSIAANYYTNAWIVQVTYACSTKGKLASSGTWDAIYTYAFPEGYPPAELKAGLYGPYYSWGTSVPVACKK
ncbi:MAG TPA: hypothetical protein VEF34_00405 [Syntrophobacteraceae bacterium]|nr:hypothetical protein [Syntrophobacteraceae bacterium]